jgi:type IV pilus assembly protein PilW
MIISKLNSDKKLKLPLTQQKGVTLIELLVAMVISMFVLLAVTTVYVTTKRTYRFQETIIQLQENARYAISTLASDIREAGYAGCNPTVRSLLKPVAGGTPYNPQAGIEGWEYTATPTGPGDIANFASSTAIGVDGDWNGVGGINLNTLLTGNVVQGTDVIAITSTVQREDLIPKPAPATSASIVFDVDHNIPDKTIVIVGDCSKGDMFQNRTGGAGAKALTRPAAGDPGNITPSNWVQAITSDMRIQVLQSKFYFIGVNIEGEPALFRTNYGQGTTGPGATPNEIAPGVENMQILYGEDLTDDEVFLPDRYVTADNITNPDNIVTVRISLLMRTPGNLNRNPIQPLPLQMLSNTPTATTVQYTTNDQRARRVFTSTIFLRNKGLYRERIGT